MSKKLIPEFPLLVLPTLVKAVGLAPGIVLQQLHYASLGREADADGWVQKSIEEWRRVHYGVFKRRTLERALTTLAEHDPPLIFRETVGVVHGTTELRVRVNHDAIEALPDADETAKKRRQTGGSKSRQSGGATDDKVAVLPTNIPELQETSEGEVDKSTSPSSELQTPQPPGGEPDNVQQVFSVWRQATGRTARTVLDARRRRIIAAALESHGLTDCLAAVRAIGADDWARGKNERRKRFDDIDHALGSAKRIETWRDQDTAATAAPTDPAGVWQGMQEPIRERCRPGQYDALIVPLRPVRIDGTGRNRILVIAGLEHIAAQTDPGRFELFLQRFAGMRVRLINDHPDAQAAA